MTNREYLRDLTDFEYSKLSIVHHMSTQPMYYMTSDNTIFEFTYETKYNVWKDAQLHEIEWLEKERK